MISVCWHFRVDVALDIKARRQSHLEFWLQYLAELRQITQSSPNMHPTSTLLCLFTVFGTLSLFPSLVHSKQDATTTLVAPTKPLVPQTSQHTGELSTYYKTITGITANSQMVKVIDKTMTILPIWYCGPSETADVCKDCPSATKGGPKCTQGFNAIVLVPLVAAAGAFIKPPPGLPTLTVQTDWDGIETYTKPPVTTKDTKPTSTTTSEEDDEMPTLPASCLLPRVNIDEEATRLPKTHYFSDDKAATKVSQPPAIDPDKTPLPVLQLTADQKYDPTDSHRLLPTPTATARLGCGPNAHPYWVGTGFSQYSLSFSRTEALNTIRKYCADMKSKKNVLGPDGFTVKGGDDTKAKKEFLKLYELDKGEHGEKRLLAIRAYYDWENRMRQDCAGSGKPIYAFATDDDGAGGLCYQSLGQTVDFCQLFLSSNTLFDF